MARIEVDLLTDQGNYAVLRLPDRQFPGMVFQGDSLSVLAAHGVKLPYAKQS